MKPQYDYYEAIRKQRGISNYKVSKDTGIAQETLSSWKNGKYYPKEPKIQVLANYFEVPALYFYEGQLSKVGSPVYDVAAGSGRINTDYPAEYLNEKLEEGYSYVRIYGDSMLPNIKDGDIVKVHHQTETNPSDYTVVKVDGESSTVKHVEIVSDGVWLRADNKEVFPDKFFTIQEVMTLPVTIIGKAVEVRREL